MPTLGDVRRVSPALEKYTQVAVFGDVAGTVKDLIAEGKVTHFGLS